MATFIFDKEGNYDLTGADEMTLNDIFKAGAYLINITATALMASKTIPTKKEKEIVLRTILNAFNEAMEDAYFEVTSDDGGIIN